MPRLAWMMCPATTTRMLRTWSFSPSKSKGEIVQFKDDTGCCHQGDAREALTDQEIGGAFRRGVHGSTFPRPTRVPDPSPKDVDSGLVCSDRGARSWTGIGGGLVPRTWATDHQRRTARCGGPPVALRLQPGGRFDAGGALIGKDLPGRTNHWLRSFPLPTPANKCRNRPR